MGIENAGNVLGDTPFSNEISKKIYYTAIADGMPDLLARLLVGQSRFETGDYTNKHCKLHNAFFSYSYDKRSKWQMPGGGSIADNGVPVAKYKTIENSVHEMTSWIRRRQKGGPFPLDLNEIKSPENYAKLLQYTGFFQGWKKYTRQQNLKIYADGIKKYMNE